MATRQREKAAALKASKDNRPNAIARHIRMSPSKVRIVLDLIRGKNYKDAETILEFTSNIACEPVLKVLRSAGANAENNLGLSVNDLFVAEAFADGGPTLKRHQPVSKGRAHEIKKRTSHIKIILDVVKN